MAEQDTSSRTSQDKGYAQGSSLGEQVDYGGDYNPELLHAIPRAAYRETLDGIPSTALLVQGVDRWLCYEVSWLDECGKPRVAVLQMDVLASSENIVESKSLKLYLNSLNQHRLGNADALLAVLQSDLQPLLGDGLQLRLMPVEDLAAADAVDHYELIDDLDADCDCYHRDPSLLQLTGQGVENERLASHLFRSHCPVTGQPDWATLKITYSGPQLERVSLLKYIVSYREHHGFHEQCVEQLIADIASLGDFSSLQVVGQFTRRGGIDITPIRGTGSATPARINRQ